MVSNPNFVRRVIFPLEVLPLPMVLAALFHALMNVVAFLALRLLMDGDFTWTFPLLPVVMLPLAVLALGASWFLAALAVYVRDVRQVMGVLRMARLLLFPAILTCALVPEVFKTIKDRVGESEYRSV